MAGIAGAVEDGFAIALMTGSYVFTSKYWIPACAGMTEGGQGGRWIHYRGAGVRFVSGLRGNDRVGTGRKMDKRV